MRFCKKRVALHLHRFRKNCKSSPSCMVNIVPMCFAKLFAFLAAPSIITSFEEERYVNFYNHVRPHQTLAYKAPARFEELYGKEETQDL